MRKLILYWLFGTENIDDYLELLFKDINHNKEVSDLIDDHLKTLRDEKEHLQTIKKLIRICENHDIDVDKEIKQIEL
jgi:hypothetical protein